MQARDALLALCCFAWALQGMVERQTHTCMLWAWQQQAGLAQDHDNQPSPQRQRAEKSDTSIARDADKHAAHADLLPRKPANFNLLPRKPANFN
eukprot:3163646-Lingulodinium_polyedra.AAC.1